MEKEQLITLVIRHIQKDLDVVDTSAIEEILDALPERTLQGFLSEAE